MKNQETDALRLVPDDQLAALIQQADDGFGYSMEMVRLVDGVRTYRLKIEGQETVEITDGEDNDYEAQQVCYRLIAEAKNKVRADAIRCALFAFDSTRPGSGQDAGQDAGREAVWKVVHEVWQLLDDAETDSAGLTTPDQDRWAAVSQAMEELEALVPNSEGPTWGGYPVNYLWPKGAAK